MAQSPPPPTEPARALGHLRHLRHALSHATAVKVTTSAVAMFLEHGAKSFSPRTALAP